MNRWHWTKTGMVQGDARESYYGVHAVKMMVVGHERVMVLKDILIKRLEKTIENGMDDCGYTGELHDLTHDQSQKIRGYKAEIIRLNNEIDSLQNILEKAEKSSKDEICKINSVKPRKPKKEHVWVFQMCPNCGNKVEYWGDAAGDTLMCGICSCKFLQDSRLIGEAETKEIDWERIKEACNPKSATVSHIPVICQAILALQKRIEFEAGLIDAMRFGSDMK